MNDSYGTTDRATPEPTASRPGLQVKELLIEADPIEAEPVDADLVDADLVDAVLADADLADADQIEEADIFALVPYDWDNDGKTLVGIGPAARAAARRSAPKAAPEPQAAPEPPNSLQPVAVASSSWGGDVEEAPPTLRPKKLGIWGVALPALLIAAAVAVVFLRALGAPPALRATERSNASVAVPVAGASAGLAIALAGLDVHVFLDGQDRGRPPVLLTGLAPGSHALSISGPAFAPFEQPVLLVAGHVSTVEPKLTFVRGSIELGLGRDADGASIEVVGSNERRQVESLPAELAAGPGEYTVHAKKPGFLPFETSVELSATSPEASVVIDLAKIAPLSAGHPGKATSDGSDESVATAGSGTLSMTSSPPSNIVLDGRPLGKAPRSLEVPAGSHTVVFVHPKYGRQSVTVNVPPDQTTSASADF